MVRVSRRLNFVERWEMVGRNWRRFLCMLWRGYEGLAIWTLFLRVMSLGMRNEILSGGKGSWRMWHGMVPPSFFTRVDILATLTVRHHDALEVNFSKETAN